MSTMVINYDEIADTTADIRKGRNELEDYADAINAIKRKLNSLPGEDEEGLIGSAISAAVRKCSDITESRSDLNTLSDRLQKFREMAASADAAVAKNINGLAEDNFDELSGLEAVGMAIYNFFCVDVPNALSSLPIFGEVVAKGREIGNVIADLKEDVLDWFQHGDGKYFLNIAIAAGEWVATAVGYCITIGGLAAAGTAAAVPLAITAIVAGGIYVVFKFVDMAAVTQTNTQALSYAREGDHGKARFYGDTDGFSSALDKYDFGGSDINAFMDSVGEGFDLTRDTAEVVYNAADLAGTVTGLGAVRGMNGDIIGQDFSFSNVWNNAKREIWDSLRKGGLHHDRDTGELAFDFVDVFVDSSADEYKHLKFWLGAGTDFVKDYIRDDKSGWDVAADAAVGALEHVNIISKLKGATIDPFKDAWDLVSDYSDVRQKGEELKDSLEKTFFNWITGGGQGLLAEVPVSAGAASGGGGGGGGRF